MTYPPRHPRYGYVRFTELRESITDIVREYLSTRYGYSHDFPNETVRRHWLDLLSAYGRYAAGASFDALCVAFRIGPPAPHWKPFCRYCGSDRLTRDAVAEWDDAAQDWTLIHVHNDDTCNACHREGYNLAMFRLEPYPPRDTGAEAAS